MVSCDCLNTFTLVIIQIILLLRKMSRHFHGLCWFLHLFYRCVYGVCFKSDTLVGTVDTISRHWHYRCISHELGYAAVTNNLFKIETRCFLRCATSSSYPKTENTVGRVRAGCCQPCGTEKEKVPGGYRKHKATMCGNGKQLGPGRQPPNRQC